LSQTLGHNFDSYLAEDLLVKADRCSMAHSLELRSPFLDTALIEYAARLPDRFLRRGTTTKWILRKAFEDVLPLEIRARRKMGFGVPLGTWFRGSWRERVSDLLRDGAQCYEFIDERFVLRVIERHMTQTADHGLLLWLLLTFELWLRRLRQSRGFGGTN
jgi:asparagine synthase (glutamine-hydrolysing)